jgi:cytidylate kinase-like protein
VVCIAGTDGADGDEVGRIVARELGFRLINQEVVLHAARIGRVEPRDVAGVEQRRSLLSRLFEQLGNTDPAQAAAVGALMPQSTGELVPASDALRGLIQTAIEEAATEASVVIVAHAASVALAAREDALRVLVTASPETRCRNLSEARGISVKEAAKVVGEADGARADYLKRFYGVRTELPTHYDLVVNTDRFTPEQAAELVVQGARR